jgi:hypothetical protein
METQAVVHVRGTPTTGKSTLLNLLYDYLKQHRPEYVVSILDSWKGYPGEDILDYDDYLMDYIKDDLTAPITKYDLRSRADLVFLIDEAQSSYDDVGFWNSLIKERSQSPGLPGPKFVLFALYGRHANPRSEKDKMHCTPSVLAPEQKVSLLPDRTCSSKLFLFFTRPEFMTLYNVAFGSPSAFSRNFHIMQRTLCGI